MKHSRFNNRDLKLVIELLDDIHLRRESTLMSKKRICFSALASLIRENRKLQDFKYIQHFVERVFDELDIGPDNRQRAKKLGDWCRDALEENA